MSEDRSSHVSPGLRGSSTEATECPACVASRRAVVDAFVLGFRAGFRMTVATQIANETPEAAPDTPRYCLEHDAMITQAYADELRGIYERPFTPEAEAAFERWHREAVESGKPVYFPFGDPDATEDDDG